MWMQVRISDMSKEDYIRYTYVFKTLICKATRSHTPDTIPKNVEGTYPGRTVVKDDAEADRHSNQSEGPKSPCADNRVGFR